MAIPTLTINWDNVNSVTEKKWLPKVVDNIFFGTPLLMTLRQQGTRVDGGERIVQPLVYGEGPGGPFQGAEPLDTSTAQQITAATFNWKHYYASASILRMEELQNSGAPAFAKLLSVKMQIMEETMLHHLSQGIFSDGSTNPKAITGLRAMVADDTTYGGIDKTVETWWQSQVDSGTATLTLAAIRTQLGLATRGRNTPNMLIGTQAQYNRIYNEMQPQQRFANQTMLNAGFTSLQVESRPFVVDWHVPTGWCFMLNTNYIDFVTHEAENMRMEPFVKPYNQPQVRTAFLFWAGNLTGSNCRFQAAFDGLSE